MCNNLCIFFLSVLAIIAMSSPCASACNKEMSQLALPDNIVALLTREEKGSDGIGNFGLCKSADAGYKCLQVPENCRKELKDFSPLLLAYIGTNDSDINAINVLSNKDPRIKTIVDFLNSPVGAAFKSDYRQLYGLALCCVHQKQQPLTVAPFNVQDRKSIAVPIKQAIEQFINRLFRAIEQPNGSLASKLVIGADQITVGRLMKNETLPAQAIVSKALDNALHEIGVYEKSQLGMLATNQVFSLILKRCAMRDYSGSLKLLNATYTGDDMLTMRFKEALAAFIQGDYAQFDPQVGDELCEVRALLLPLMREGKIDLPCLKLFLGEKTDLAALIIFSSYILTVPLPGISAYRGRSLQPLIDKVCGTDGDFSRLPESSYAALKKLLSSISLLFLRDVAQESGDNDLVLGCNNLFLNAKGCLTMPFYCSIKALVYALKRYQMPVFFRTMKVSGSLKISGSECAVGPCCYTLCNKGGELQGPCMVYECKNVPSGIDYSREKMSSQDGPRDHKFEAMSSEMIESYGFDNIILQDAAQHDQLINPTVEQLTKICPYIGYVPQKNVRREILQKEIELSTVIKLFSQCGLLAQDFQDRLNAARMAKMDEGRKCQHDIGASRREEIKLIVSHVFAADVSSYLKECLKSTRKAGRRVCCI